MLTISADRIECKNSQYNPIFKKPSPVEQELINEGLKELNREEGENCTSHLVAVV